MSKNNYIRTNGRAADELRKVSIKAGIIKNADGSAIIEFGKNKIIAAVFGPKEVHPKHMMRNDQAIIKCRYHMMPFSTDTRKNPSLSRREIEISKVIREAIQPAIIMEDYPRTAIEVYIEILQSDGGSRCAAINAASVALADAGINMRDLITACAAGKADGKIILDVDDVEDKTGEADMPLSILPNLGTITLFQLDGCLSEEEFKQALEMATNGCKKLYELQRNALMNKYFNNNKNKGV
ncbi:MAG: exosome complex exonuclease Rrp41 [Thaumarchaeota archaeon]|nr:exosome complex exonuclease Rrp41 [Nitrososphaerota archaeon]|tara:strand:+ start:894 stop:1610 length:717 start_codon:yes stop_codon:yes gene_type:complete